jgi:hypothetical protein
LSDADFGCQGRFSSDLWTEWRDMTLASYARRMLLVRLAFFILEMHCRCSDACPLHCRWWWLHADEQVHMPRINVHVRVMVSIFV